MSGTTGFEQRYGFARNQVRLGNWRQAPYSRWSLQNVAELVPTAPVWPGVTEEEAQDPFWLLDRRIAVSGSDLAETETIQAFLTRSHGDALCVMKSGRFLADWSAPHADFGNRHLAFSITKSITAVLVGALQEDGLIDPAALVSRYVPEAVGSAYGDATVQNVLDMEVALDMDEAYLDPNSAFARYRRAMLWNPGGGDEGLFDFLCSLPRLATPHGEVFRYRSPNTDMLGIIVERATGLRLPDLLRARIFAPLGAQGAVTMTVDCEGTSRASAGISLTPRDLARLGEMMRLGGQIGGRRIVSQDWVTRTITGGNKQAWDRSDFHDLFPKGRYHNKWYQTGEGAFCGIGIHGQWVWVDPATEVVIVKMSSQPEPADDGLDAQNIAFLGQLSRMV